MFFRRKPNLDDVAIAAPCPTSWEGMEGDDKVRYCSLCSLNVYNLSGMTRKEGETLMKSANGPMCIRLFRRKDGTLITKDCPVGRRLRDAFSRKIKAVAVSIAACFQTNSALAEGQENRPTGETSPASNDRSLTPEYRRRASQGLSFVSNPWRKDVQKSPHEADNQVRARWGGSVNVWHKEEAVMPRGYAPPEETPETKKLQKKFESSFGKPLTASLAPVKAADRSAWEAYNDARNAELTGFTSRASSRYQFAIYQFIRDRDAHDPVFQSQVATAYAKFLKKQNQPEQAEAILDEFCKKR
ncbi:MAG: hypothetical protein JST89_05975 [Cyanobacteria bacterium SZAS-4]|nr:hypothetical protein [Cyanobacteria bacterium SZAS-4]